MIVEALFWFHPAVWWIGARLIEERERACDEAVVQACGKAEVYAEGILNVCRLYFESPVACVSGVTGSDLKQRIVRIMAEVPAVKLNFSGKLLLAIAGTASIILPLVAGLFSAAHLSAQLLRATGPLPSFEVATIKPTQPGSTHSDLRIRSSEGRIWFLDEPLDRVIEFAYNVKSERQLLQEPDWARSERFDIEAKVPESQLGTMKDWTAQRRMDQYRLMFQSLLAERFNLHVGFETRTLPVYRLVVAKGGPNGTLMRPDPGNRSSITTNVNERAGKVTAIGVSTATLADWLSRTPDAGDRVVIDSTGLHGSYDFTLAWTPFGAQPSPMGGAQPLAAASTDDSAPSLFAALRQQLGLKLVPAKAPVEALVIDHIEQPSPN